VGVPAHGTSEWKEQAVQEDAFLALAVGPAQASQKKTGVPASVTLAQAILESGWGDQHMGDACNYFGIKAQSGEPSVTMRTREVEGGKSVFVDAAFRRFASVEECFAAHGHFLRDNSRYANAFQAADGESFARAIAAAGYATDPKYADLLVQIIRENNLTQYDTGVKPKPAAPAVSAKASAVYGLRQPPLRGPVVTAIQHALAKAGCDPGQVDGVFGKGTDAAVRRYQSAHGLVADGVVGRTTAGRLGVKLVPT
jgi:hypothetical protein